MKVTVLQENVQQALLDAQKSISTRPSLPILSCFLLQTIEQGLIFSATDLNIGVRTQIAAQVQKEGKIAVPAKIFADYVATLDAGELTLEVKEQKLTITGRGSHATIQCLQAEDYPSFPEKEGQEFRLPAELFTNLVQQTAFATSADDARPILTTLLFSFREDQLEVVGTDGFRLATLTTPEIKTAAPQQFLMPAKALHEVIRIMSRKQATEAVFTVSQTLKQIFFSFAGTDMLVRLLEGDFPPYQKIIPPAFATQVTFSGSEFAQKLKTAMIFARDSSGIVRLELGKDTLTLKSASSVAGTQESAMPLQMAQGEPLEIAFTAKYLADFLQVLKPGTIWLGVNESLKPALFRPAEALNYRYIIMPFRVNQ